MRINTFLIILIFHFLSFCGYAQNWQTIDSLKTAIFQEESDTLKIDLLNDLSSQYSQTNRDSAIYFLEEALGKAREINAPRQKARTYANLGGVYCFKGEYLKALEYLDLAFNIAQEYEYYNILAHIHYIKSIVFISIDKLNLANEHAAKSLKYNKALNNIEGIASVFTLFSTIYDALDDPAKSLEFAIKAYELNLQQKGTTGISTDLNNLSIRYRKLKKNDSAYIYIQQAIALNKKYGHKDWLAINYSNLADLLLEENKTDSANLYIDMALALYNEVGYMLNYYALLDKKAEIALIRKDTNMAIQFYKDIIEAPQFFEGLKVKANAYKGLYELAYVQNQYVRAIEYYKAYNLFDDSLKQETNTSLLTVMELQMEYEKHTNQLELENREVKLNLQHKNFYLIALSGLIFLLALTIYFVYRLQLIKSKAIRIEKQLIEEELDSKKREMTANVMTLLKKNEILNDISRKLLEIEKGAIKDETKEAISKISDEVNKSKDVELWDEFNVRFRQVHHEFYDTLLQNYPELSPNEQRMCAFLRMNMSTKDISELTGLDRKTVDNTRYRIRKKLNLDSKTNLISFLSKL